MKIISHNVNGLSAYIKNGKLSRILLEEADVYCFQEVKVSTRQKLEDLLGDLMYDYTIAYVQNNFKKGYAGVLTMVKKNTAGKVLDHIDRPEDNTTILEGLSNYSCGRVVTCDFGSFYLINVYVVNSGSGKADERIKFDDKLESYLLSLSKPYIICGDFNVCHTKLDYYGNWTRAINTMPGLMEFEIDDFFGMLATCGLKDGFRVTHPETRKYSWCSPRTKNPLKGWRLDYFLCSEGININRCDIMQGWNSFDHSPIVLEIDL